jgi:hypothetical protein
VTVIPVRKVSALGCVGSPIVSGAGASMQRTLNPPNNDDQDDYKEQGAVPRCVKSWLRILPPPKIDHLLDPDSISFDNSGELLVFRVAHRDSMKKMGIITDHAANIGDLAELRPEFPRRDRVVNGVVPATSRDCAQLSTRRQH